jgi:hypothetical protein
MQGFQDTVRLTPPKHPDRAGHLQSLALSFTDRFRRLGKPEDLAAIHTHYDESFKLPSGPPKVHGSRLSYGLILIDSSSHLNV